jgi:DNA repair exonuclease SbcCD ATPase subunit
MTGTLHEAIMRNISLQANAKISEEVIQSFDTEINRLNTEIENLNGQLHNRDVSKDESVKSLEEHNRHLQNEISSLKRIQNELDTVKSQAQHVETFRNELQKARQENEELKKKIEYLQLTPAKRKKVDEANIMAITTSTVLSVAKEETKDGGSF